MRKKASIFKKFIDSIYNMNEYMNYIKEGLFRAILYAFVLSIFLGGIKGTIEGIRVNNIIDEAINELNLGEYKFNISNGKLSINKSPIKLDEDNIFIYIDKDISKDDKKSIKPLIVNYDEYFLVLQDGIIMSSDMSEDAKNSNIEVSYSEIESTGIKLNNSTMTSILEKVKKPMFIIEVVMFIFKDFIMYIMMAVLIALFALLHSRILGLNLRLSEICALVVYAATLPNLLVIGFNIIIPEATFDTAVMIGTLVYTYIILRNLKKQQKDEIEI